MHGINGMGLAWLLLGGDGNVLIGFLVAFSFFFLFFVLSIYVFWFNLHAFGFSILSVGIVKSD